MVLLEPIQLLIQCGGINLAIFVVKTRPLVTMIHLVKRDGDVNICATQSAWTMWEHVEFYAFDMQKVAPYLSAEFSGSAGNLCD